MKLKFKFNIMQNLNIFKIIIVKIYHILIYSNLIKSLGPWNK